MTIAWVGVALLLLGCGKKPTPPRHDEVWVIHGLGRTNLSMTEMERCLQEAGYVVEAWGYDSLETPILDAGRDLQRDLVARAKQPAPPRRIHLVTHSLGGIVVRAMLMRGKPRNLGRVVMLAPPNQGSPWARRAEEVVGNRVPALEGLSDSEESLVNTLGPVEGVDVGIIAGQFDLKVPLESTQLKGAKDHVVVPSFHTFIMNRHDVCEYTLQFLETGAFEAGGTAGQNRPTP